MGVIRLGFLRHSLHAGCASAVARVIEAHALEVEYIDLARQEVVQALTRQEVDIYASAWLPLDNALLTGNFRSVGDLYQPAPEWLSFGDVSIEISGLTAINEVYVAASVSALFPDQIDAFKSATPIQVTVVDDAQLYERINAAALHQRRFLVAAMTPHAVFFDTRFKILEKGPIQLDMLIRAPLLISETLEESGDTDLIDELSEMMLGTKVMSALDYAISVENIDPEDAAESWQRGRLIPR